MLLGCRARVGVAGPVWGAGLCLSLVRGQLSRISLGRMQPLGRVRHRNGLNEVCPCCADVPGAPGTCLRQGSVRQQDLLHAGCMGRAATPQELLQGFDNSPQGMGRLRDGGRRAVEGVAVIPALLSKVRRDR